jgi:glutaredoxin
LELLTVSIIIYAVKDCQACEAAKKKYPNAEVRDGRRLWGESELEGDDTDVEALTALMMTQSGRREFPVIFQTVKVRNLECVQVGSWKRKGWE